MSPAPTQRPLPAPEPPPSPSAPASARARVRQELTREILVAARRHLAGTGAAGLSLRAVARDLGMAPSALYRYYDGRDRLLTAMIVEAYQELGSAAAAADAVADRGDHLGRWLAATEAIWVWGHDHPHDWALIYGSPVPGYVAPEETVPAALAVTLVLVGVISDAVLAGRLGPVAPGPPVPPALGADLDTVRALSPAELDDDHVVATIGAWGQALGLVSLHLFGHLEGAVTDPAALHRHLMASEAARLGLRPR